MQGGVPFPRLPQVAIHSHAYRISSEAKNLQLLATLEQTLHYALYVVEEPT